MSEKFSESQRNKFYKKAIETWGVKSQHVIAIEEMSELQKELCKYLRRTENKGEYTKQEIAEIISNIQEETADVLITVGQIRNIFGADEVDKVIDRKLQRGFGRLDKWNQENKK